VNEPVKPESSEQPSAAEQDWRQRLLKANLSLPTDRVRSAKKAAPVRTAGTAQRSVVPVAPPPAHSGGAEYLSVKGTLHQRLLDELDRRNLLAASEETLTEFVQTFVDEALRVEDLPLNEDERRRLVGDLLEETLGVGPLASLMADPAVTDVLVNRPEQVYVERFGRLEKTDVRFRDVDHLVRIIQRIAARVGRRIDESSPMVDARLPDGSRVNATLPPVTLDSPTLSIRRFGRQRLRRSDLLQLGMFSADIHDFLDAVVRGRKNVLISGGTGSGKSTLLGALAEAIPDRERIVTVEDSAELILDQEHVVRMETRPVNIEGKGLITARDLVVNALRMRPDRIIVGEVRSGEALDMLQAMNTGHDGGMTTVHANSPRDAFARLETMVLMAGLELPSRAIREQIVSALHLIVHVRRFEDGVRRVESIAEIVGMEGTTPQLQDIFRFERHGLRGRQIAGEFVATGIVPRVVEELHERGIEVPRTIFQKGKPTHA
jgi:pilus assembly protein CpaF